MYVLLLVATTKSEIMDYTNHDFPLYKDTVENKVRLLKSGNAVMYYIDIFLLRKWSISV